jgi:hypothetical protein
MRSIIAVTALAIVLVAVGCNLAPHRRDPGGRIPGDPAAVPTVDNLISYLNRNANNLGENQALQCTNLAIDAKADNQSVGLDGMMVCQKPRNFRLTAKVLGSPTVDIGSNKDEFWYWISKNQPPYLFHCSYEALKKGTQIPFPFQPEMAVAALGLATYDPHPAKPYELKVVNDKNGHKVFELTEHTISPQNKRIQKVVVFDANAVNPPQPQVIAHVLKDENGKVICVANIRKAQRVGPDAIFPKEIVFNWPAQKMQMSMHIDKPQIMEIGSDRAARLFTRKGLSYETYDLATGPRNGGLQQASGLVPQR